MAGHGFTGSTTNDKWRHTENREPMSFRVACHGWWLRVVSRQMEKLGGELNGTGIGSSGWRTGK